MICSDELRRTTLKLALGLLSALICSAAIGGEQPGRAGLQQVATFFVYVPAGRTGRQRHAHIGLRLDRLDVGWLGPDHKDALQSASLLDLRIGRRDAGAPLAVRLEGDEKTSSEDGQGKNGKGQGWLKGHPGHIAIVVGGSLGLAGLLCVTDSGCSSRNADEWF